MKLQNIILAIVCATWSGLFAMETIKVQESNFADEKGNVIIFQGVSTSDPDKLEKQGHWNDRYFQEISDWGANLVRFPVHPSAWRERGADAYLELLDNGIAWAKKYEMYVIIDWHIIGNLRNQLFQHAMYQTTIDETHDFWRTIAFRYRNEPAVAFYELYNEPTISGKRFGDMTWDQLKKLYLDMLTIIRAYDHNTICLIAGFNWAYDLMQVKNSPLVAANIAYVSHPYPQKREQPWEEKWEQDWGFVADNYPVILTEIGFCLEDERGAHIPVMSTEEYGKALTSYAEKKGISWVAWVFDAEWSPMLIWDWDFTPTTQGKFFKNYMQSKK